MPSALVIPLVNPNEPDALVAQVHVQNRQHVEIGEIVCTLETTKSAADLAASQAGYILGIQFQAGQTARSGDVFCYIAEDPNWPLPAVPQAESADQQDLFSQAFPPGLRITQPALQLARELKLAPEDLPFDRLVTESLVRSIAESTSRSISSKLPDNDFDPFAIIVYGAGGHGKTVIELIMAAGGFRIHGVIDDDPQVVGQVAGIPVLGGAEKLPELWSQGIRQAANAVGGIGDIDVRVRVFEKLSQARFSCPSLIHPRSFVEKSAQVADGSQIMPLAYVGSEAKVGFGCIVNTGSILSHDCVVGEYSNIAPGAILAGEVKLAPRVLVGMGVTVNLRVEIGEGARLGNGSTIKDHVPARGIVRAGAIWPN